MKRLLIILFVANVFISFGQSRIVKIGNQSWSLKNLNVDEFRNGDRIFEAKSDEDWIWANRNEKPAWCHYDNLSNNDSRYGKLYNWYAITDSRGLAPDGWHIPAVSEWEEFYENGGTLKEIGFNRIRGGLREELGQFRYAERYGYWWTSSIDCYRLQGGSSFDVGNVHCGEETIGLGMYVRCLKD